MAEEAAEVAATEEAAATQVIVRLITIICCRCIQLPGRVLGYILA